MHDEIVAALTAGPEVRRIEPVLLRRLGDHFPRRMEECLAQGARRHPLGFAHVVEPLKNGCTLRYHLWPRGWEPAAAEAAADVHDHAYELDSLVVGGELRHEAFCIDERPDGPLEVLEVEYLEGRSRLVRTGRRAAVQLEAAVAHAAGTAYHLDPGRIHRVRTFGRACATLVATTGGAWAAAPRVFLPAGSPIPEQNERPLLSTNEVDEARDALTILFRPS